MWNYCLRLRTKLRRFRQRRQVTQQLPELIRTLITCMSAGHSLKSALAETAAHLQPPLSDWLHEVLVKHQAGINLSEALRDLATQFPSEEMELLITALILAAESGVSLREVLSRVESIALGKKELHEKVMAITAQGRLQGWVMAALPLLLILVIQWVDPLYLQPLTQTELGKWILAATGVLNLIGILWIRRITQLSI